MVRKSHTKQSLFQPEPSGTATVEFTFDSKYIKADTDIVVFESLYKDGKELAVHADINDEGRTVTVKVPEIKKLQQTSMVKKKLQQRAKSLLMMLLNTKILQPEKNIKSLELLWIRQQESRSGLRVKRLQARWHSHLKKSNGEVTVSFTFDSKYIKETTELVVFETLYRDNTEIAVHADLEDEGQTVKINVPVPEKPSTPKTGDENNMALWVSLGSFSALGIAVLTSYLIRKRKINKED